MPTLTAVGQDRDSTVSVSVRRLRNPRARRHRLQPTSGSPTPLRQARSRNSNMSRTAKPSSAGAAVSLAFAVSASITPRRHHGPAASPPERRWGIEVGVARIQRRGIGRSRVADYAIPMKSPLAHFSESRGVMMVCKNALDRRAYPRKPQIRRPPTNRVNRRRRSSPFRDPMSR